MSCRITHPVMLQIVNNKRMPFNLSHLAKDEQEQLKKVMENLTQFILRSRQNACKNKTGTENLFSEFMEAVLTNEKATSVNVADSRWKM